MGRFTMTEKTKAPAVEGLFTMDPRDPRLLGTQCRACGTYFFPAERTFCRNPSCDRADLEEVPLSSKGKVWSYTSASYKPPPPFVAKEPFEPFAIAAVELEAMATGAVFFVQHLPPGQLEWNFDGFRGNRRAGEERRANHREANYMGKLLHLIS